MASLSAVTLNARRLVGDGPTDNLVRHENLNNSDIGNVLDGATTMFAVVNFPIAPGGIQNVYVDGVQLNPSTDFTTYENTGQLTFSAAPAQSAYATYYYYLIDDSGWAAFIIQGLRKLGYPDVSQMPESLIAALVQYAASAWAQRIASQTGLWYNQKLQIRDEQRDSVSSKYSKMSKEYALQGDALRDAYYSGQGRQLKASFRILQMQPRGWTPTR